ncbi:hypothetical protein AB0D15_38665, partial [Streptomyces sp. NPDC048551]
VLAVGATVSAVGVLRLEPKLPAEAVHPQPRPGPDAPATEAEPASVSVPVSVTEPGTAAAART